MWDPILAPSAWHGVTTVITGNCSVGFAPLRSDDRSFSLRVMEAVEEIPCAVMEAGIDFDWETYPEYLDALDRRQHTIDIGTQVAHVALRAYVMGERAERNEEGVLQRTSRRCPNSRRERCALEHWVWRALAPRRTVTSMARWCRERSPMRTNCFSSVRWSARSRAESCNIWGTSSTSITTFPTPSSWRGQRRPPSTSS